MPRKIRQLIGELKKAGFIDRGGKGSHRNFMHPSGARVTLSGKEGDDAKRYQELEVATQIASTQTPPRDNQ
jgi:predicted RNA binding protein YcfA (HicA-like mRNA interferase family)